MSEEIEEIKEIEKVKDKVMDLSSLGKRRFTPLGYYLDRGFGRGRHLLLKIIKSERAKEFEFKLRAGEHPREIARWCIKEGLYQGEVWHLSMAIKKLQQMIPLDERLPKNWYEMHLQAILKTPEVDVVEELHKLIEYQKWRMGLLGEKEEQIGVAMKAQSENVKILATLIKMYEDSCYRLGITPSKAVKELEAEIEQEISEEERERILEEVERLRRGEY
jgi:hypothetical protein